MIMVSRYVKVCILLMVTIVSSEIPRGNRQTSLAGTTGTTGNKYVNPGYPYGIGNPFYSPGGFGGLEYGGFPGAGGYPGAGVGGYPGVYPGILGYGGYPGLGYGGYPGIGGYGGYPGIGGYGGYPGIGGYGGYPGLGYGGINYGNVGFPFINPLFRNS